MIYFCYYCCLRTTKYSFVRKLLIKDNLFIGSFQHCSNKRVTHPSHEKFTSFSVACPNIRPAKSPHQCPSKGFHHALLRTTKDGIENFITNHIRTSFATPRRIDGAGASLLASSLSERTILTGSFPGIAILGMTTGMASSVSVG